MYRYDHFPAADVAQAATQKILASLGVRAFAKSHPLADIPEAEELTIRGVARILGHQVLAARRSNDLGRPSQEIMAGLTTSDFGTVLDDVCKTLLGRSFAANTDHRRLFQAVDAPDFRPFQVGDVESNGDFTAVNENGEYKAVAISQSGEEMQIARYGKILDISPEVIIDDAISIVRRAVEDTAQAAGRHEQRISYGVIVSPPALSDAQAFYGAGNSVNISGLTTTELSKVFAKLRGQELGGSAANLAPNHLLVSPNNELVVKALLFSSGVSLDVHVFPGCADTDLYLLAGPAAHASFGLAFMGATEPVLARQQPTVKTAAARYRISHAFDAKPLSRTGVVKATIGGGE